MQLTELPLLSENWIAPPATAQALIVALQERIRDLEARLLQNSADASRVRVQPRDRSESRRRLPAPQGVPKRIPQA